MLYSLNGSGFVAPAHVSSNVHHQLYSTSVFIVGVPRRCSIGTTD